MSDPLNLIGRILQDTYRLERLLGGGGMGAVYEAAHLRLPRRFAVKVLFRSVAQRPDLMARFQREAEVTSALGHPHIVEVVDFNQSADGLSYLVMELLEGEDLAARLQRVNHLEISTVGFILKQAAAALQAAHDRGIIHRDLKPQNIFLCQTRERADLVKIVDFGISKVLSSSSMMTGEETLLGTPSYMSPEQAQGRAAEVDARTDIFAMGCLLYEMLTGHLPFKGESIPEVLFKIVHTAPLPLRSWRAALPEGLCQVVLHALEKKPQDRPASINALSIEFDRAFQQSRPDILLSSLLNPEEAAPAAVLPTDPAAQSTLAATANPAATGPGFAIVTPEQIASTSASRSFSAISLAPTSSTKMARPILSLSNTASPLKQALLDLAQQKPEEKSVDEQQPAKPPIPTVTIPLPRLNFRLMKIALLTVLIFFCSWLIWRWITPLDVASSQVRQSVEQIGQQTLHSLSQSSVFLHEQQQQNPCFPPTALARALLPDTTPTERQTIFATLANCRRQNSFISDLSRLLRQTIRPDDNAQTSVDLNALAQKYPTAPDVPLIQALIYYSLEQPDQAQASLERWRTLGQRFPTQAWIAPSVAQTILLSLDEHLLFANIYELNGATLPALIAQAQQSLVQGYVERAKQLIVKAQAISESYEPLLILKARLYLAERNLPEARSAILKLLANGGRFTQRGQHLLADLALAQGQINEARQILSSAARQLSEPTPLWSAQTWMRLGDICSVLRSRGCAREAYGQAAENARRAGHTRLATRAQLFVAAYDFDPAAAANNSVAANAFWTKLEKITQASSLEKSETEAFRAWMSYREGKFIKAAMLFRTLPKNTEFFRRFRIFAADTWLEIGEPHDALTIVQPLLFTPVAHDDLVAAIAAMHTAALATEVLGQPLRATHFAQAFLVYWGGAESELSGSKFWRGKIEYARQLAAQEKEQTANLYGTGLRLWIAPTNLPPPNQTLIQEIKKQFSRRFLLMESAPASLTPSEMAIWNKGRMTRPNYPDALIQFSLSANQQLQIRRLDPDSLQELATVSLPLAATAPQIQNALAALFPLSNQPRIYGNYAAAQFKRCYGCFRRVREEEQSIAATAELTLFFDGLGRLLPSKINKVLPAPPSKLLGCLRDCLDKLQLPAFSSEAKPQLLLDINYSSSSLGGGLLRSEAQFTNN